MLTVLVQYHAEKAKLLGKKVSAVETEPAEEKKDGPQGYVPPHMRNRDGFGGPQEEEKATLRVTNVSTDATREDMHELFKQFGPIARVSVPTDRATGEGRGFAFIDFYNREDAQVREELVRCSWL